MHQSEVDAIVESLMVGAGEEFPADPALDDTWCLSDKELRILLARAIEEALECLDIEIEG